MGTRMDFYDEIVAIISTPYDPKPYALNLHSLCLLGRRGVLGARYGPTESPEDT